MSHQMSNVQILKNPIIFLQIHRVLMLGGEKVGKSSLVSQFMTSEYLHAYDTSIGEYFSPLFRLSTT